MFSAALLPVSAGYALPLLLDVAAKGLVVSAAVLTALLGLRRASAATRHLVLLAGLGVLLGLPVLMALLPRQEFPHPVPAPRAAPAAALVPTLPLPTAPLVSETPAPPLAPAPVDAAPVASLPPLAAAPAVTPAPASTPSIRPGWLVLGWLVGVLACTARMLAAQARVWRLTRRCPPLPPSLLPSTGLGTVPFAALLTGPQGTPPMVWGWPRAALLLPPEAADWPDARRRAVVLHEAAHVRRCDWLTQTVAQAACALHWFNPLLWLLAARLGAEAERACDDAVLLAGVTPADYAQDLLAVARHLGAGRTQRRVSAGAVTMARRSPVRGRLEAILDTRRARRRVTRRSAALALAAALAVAAPLAVLRPAARAAEGKAAQAEPSPDVPTEADIAKVKRHLRGLEQARAVYDYASAQPNMLTPAQTALVDRLIQQRELKRGYDNFEERLKADFERGRAEAQKPHTKQERERIWGPIFAYEHRPPSVIKRQHDFNASLAQLESKVDALDEYQVLRETRMYAIERKIALDSTRVEAMQMERDLGYSLHLSEDDIASMADLGFQWEKKGQLPRAATVHVFLLFDKLKQQKSLDDADIDSLIAILHEPSRTPSVTRTDVMTLFHGLPDASPAQRQKICEAVTPFLTSGDKWERKDAGAVLRKFGGSAPLPPIQKAQAVPAAIPPAHPRPIRQAVQTGVPSITPLKSIKPALLKTAAFATLAAGLALPAAPAAPPAPAPKPEAPKPAAQASVVQVPATGASHWASFLLRHTPLWKVRAFTGWDRGETLPEGVVNVYFLESNRSVLVRATPTGITHMQGIISRLDSLLRPVQLRVAFATVTAAELDASGLHSDEVPPGGPGATGKSSQLFMEGAEGSAVAAYLAALEKRKAIVAAPIITTDINVPATISMEAPYLVSDSRSVQVLIMPRLDKEGVLTLQMTPPRSPRAEADRNTPPAVPIVRPVSIGTTFVLVNPLPPAAGGGERYLLIFVTPTGVTVPDPATPPQMIP